MGPKDYVKSQKVAIKDLERKEHMVKMNDFVGGEVVGRRGRKGRAVRR